MSRKTESEGVRNSATKLKRVFLDVAGPMKNQFMSRSRYFVTLLDQCSDRSLIKFVYRKSQVAGSAVKMMLKFKILFTFQSGKRSRVNRKNVK